MKKSTDENLRPRYLFAWLRAKKDFINIVERVPPLFIGLFNVKLVNKIAVHFIRNTQN